MTQAPRRWPVPRFTLGRLMAIVGVFAGSFAMYGALSRSIQGINVPGGILLVTLYDILIFLVIQAIRRLVAPREGGRPSPALVAIAVLVLASCAGLPLMVLGNAFLGGNHR